MRKERVGKGNKREALSPREKGIGREEVGMVTRKRREDGERRGKV